MNTSFAIARSLSLLALAAAATAAQAQYSAVPIWSSTPSSQLSSTHSGTTFLTLSTTPADITVSGKFAVNVPNTPSNGTLAFWIVDRPMTANQLYANFMTTTVLDGFSAPPPGTIGVTHGTVRTFITDLSIPNSVIGNSMSSISIALNPGFTQWNNLSATSASFSLLTGNNYALRQVFDLDGIYTSGPGGTWVVDVPVLSSLAAVPEPTSTAMLVAGLAGMLAMTVARRERL